jgi:hypothetical protein
LMLSSPPSSLACEWNTELYRTTSDILNTSYISHQKKGRNILLNTTSINKVIGYR